MHPLFFFIVHLQREFHQFWVSKQIVLFAGGRNSFNSLLRSILRFSVLEIIFSSKIPLRPTLGSNSMETVYCGYSLSLKTRNSDFAGLPIAAFHFSVKWHHLLIFVDQLGVPIDFQDTTLSQTSQLLEMPLCILSWQSLCETHLERVLDALGVHRGFWADIMRVIMRGASWGLGNGHRQFDMNINLELATKEEIEVEMEDIEEVSSGGYESDPDQVTRGVSKSINEELEKKSYSVQDDDRCCCICLDELSGANKVIEIPCLHLFHSRCIVKWLERNDSCPLCRSKVEV